MVISPRRLTFVRWRKLSGIKYSLLRSLEFEAIENLNLPGLTLDVGGGTPNSYWHRLQAEREIESLNYSPEMNPTYLANLNNEMPIPSSRYDNVLCFNTLEHLYRDQFVLREILRILKPGGIAYLLIPFVYRVHTSGPTSDFHRHTGYAWQDMLAEAGFDQEASTVEPLFFGNLASGFALVEAEFPKPLRWLLKKIIMLAMVLRDSVRRQPLTVCDIPLGYYIIVRKREV